MPDHRVSLYGPRATASPPPIPSASSRPATAPAPSRTVFPPPSHLLEDLVDPDSSFLDLHGVSIHFKLWAGPGAAVEHPRDRLLVCLHGFGASFFSYQLAVPALLHTSPRQSVLAYDAPGFGLTSRPSSRRLHSYTPRFSAKVATTLADAHPTSFTAILGHSLGAVAATTAVLNDPARYDALILTAPALLPSGSPLPNPLQTLLRTTLSALTWIAILFSILVNPLLVALLRRVVRSDSFWSTGLRMARADDHVPPNVLEGYKAPMRAPRWERGVLNFCRAAFAERARALKAREDLVEQLAALGDAAPPVLIVHGEQDRVVPLSNSRRLADMLPGSHLVVLTECGHVPHEEDSARFAGVVKEFLDEVEHQRDCGF